MNSTVYSVNNYENMLWLLNYSNILKTNSIDKYQIKILHCKLKANTINS